MKKFATVFFTLCLLLGVGTGVLAKSDIIKCNFGQMLPMLKEKFPDLTVQQLQEKHKACVVQMQKQSETDCSAMMGK